MANYEKKIHETCEAIARSYINIAFSVIHPEVLEDFPHFPEGNF
jgi:hypothetical protein